jgi:hypothetical protein
VRGAYGFGGAGFRLRQTRSSKVSRVECVVNGRNRNTFAIHGSGVPFPDVLSENCWGLNGILRTSSLSSQSPAPQKSYAPLTTTFFLANTLAIFTIKKASWTTWIDVLIL